MSTTSGEKVLKRIASGLPPLCGGSWPLVDHQQSYLKAQPMEDLWPDLRKGSKGDKKRRAHAGHAKAKFRCVEFEAGVDNHLPLPDDAILLEAENDEQDLQIHFYLKGVNEDPWGDQDAAWQPF